MKRITLFLLLSCALYCSAASADSKPAASNIMGSEYPQVHADRSATFRLKAPDAQKVQIRFLGGKSYDMTKGADGYWMGTAPPQVVGFHYYTFMVDGANVSD